ncbi:MAG: hypothetical protein QF885_06620, partial [Candidatus Thalassarchaeaceae archaeon]|nr:hypothetical protein [Candidatus Thalassarchaeaceae archaeon]
VQSEQGRTKPTAHLGTPVTGEDRGEWGACCLPDGSCVMENASDCFSNWGGTYVGGECSDNPCPDPIGACCNTSGYECELLTEPGCEIEGGYWQGGATDCESAGCAMDPWGSCCLPYGGCESMTLWECDQEYMDDGGMAGDNWQAYTTCEEANCAPTCDPTGFFDNVAYPLTISCQDGPTAWPASDLAGAGCMGAEMGFYEYIKIDLNGDNAPETIMSKSCLSEWENNRGRVLVAGKNPGTVDMLDLINIHPDAMIYTDYTWDGMTQIYLLDFLDVTGDGLPDAIISIGWCDPTMPCDPVGVFYVTNISTPPGVACASDVNSDGTTDVNDILALISGWGPCVQ